MFKLFKHKKTAPPLPSTRSKWRLVYDNSAGWVDMCPECKEFGNGESFCPHCGAQMLEDVTYD